jgi:hypothetical protein
VAGGVGRVVPQDEHHVCRAVLDDRVPGQPEVPQDVEHLDVPSEHRSHHRRHSALAGLGDQRLHQSRSDPTTLVVVVDRDGELDRAVRKLVGRTNGDDVPARLDHEGVQRAQRVRQHLDVLGCTLGRRRQETLPGRPRGQV